MMGNRLGSLLAPLGFVLGSLVMADVASAQDLHPSRRPSPMGMARITLDDAYLRVVYGRPYKRGRENIFGTKESGALVPFGELWRTGANEATEITVTRDVLVGGERLPAGTYSLFTTPGPERWKVHFNSALGLWGSRDYDAAKDVAVATAAVSALSAEVDQFTVEFEKKEGGADLILRWIDTEVRLPVKLAG
jgi:hypothetical protein